MEGGTRTREQTQTLDPFHEGLTSQSLAPKVVPLADPKHQEGTDSPDSCVKTQSSCGPPGALCKGASLCAEMHEGEPGAKSRPQTYAGDGKDGGAFSAATVSQPRHRPTPRAALGGSTARATSPSMGFRYHAHSLDRKSVV